MVKVGGKRASLSDLTQVLRRIPGVVDAVYLRDRPSGRLASRLVALVVAPGLDRETIQAALRERVDPVFLPRPLHLVAALPRTSVGKLRGDELRGLLRDLDAGESGREAQRR
jgi:acyl-coenzyme A synthetase/AMP-(fatty) acid ligase